MISFIIKCKVCGINQGSGECKDETTADQLEELKNSVLCGDCFKNKELEIEE